MIQKLYVVCCFGLGSYFFPSSYLSSPLLLYIVHSSLSASVFCSLPINFLWLSSSFLVKVFCWLEEEIGTGCPRLVMCAVLCSKNLSLKKKNQKVGKSPWKLPFGSSFLGVSQNMIFPNSILKSSIFAGMSAKKMDILSISPQSQILLLARYVFAIGINTLNQKFRKLEGNFPLQIFLLCHL